MKNIILILVLSLTVPFVKAKDKEIRAEVIFENLTNNELTKGELYIVEIDKTIEVTNANSLNIALPKKGKYRFVFSTDEFTAYTYYPEKMTAENHTVTIQLRSKNEQSLHNSVYSYALNTDKTLTNEQIHDGITDGTLNFILNGLDATVPEEYIVFKEKYGVGLVKENCVLDPMSFKKATENNQMIADYLDETYGESWRNELVTKPFGIK